MQTEDRCFTPDRTQTPGLASEGRSTTVLICVLRHPNRIDCSTIGMEGFPYRAVPAPVGAQAGAFFPMRYVPSRSSEGEA